MDYIFGEVGKHYFLRKQAFATGGKGCDCTYIGKDIASAEEAAESLRTNTMKPAGVAFILRIVSGERF